MKNLIFFELKKIIGRRMTVLVLLGAIFLSILFFILGVMGEKHISSNSRDNQSVQTLHGLEAIHFDQEGMSELKGYLTDEYILKREIERATIETNPTNLEKTPDKNLAERKKNMREAGYSEDLIENIPITWLKDGVYVREIDKYDYLQSHVGVMQRIPEIISELENANSNEIYKNRPGQFSDAKKPSLADAETSKLLGMYKKVDKQPYYDYYHGWERLSMSFSGLVAFVVGAVIVICLSPVFSQEYSNKTDAIVLPTKYGKSKVIVAKLFSSFIFTTVTFLLFAVINFSLYAAIYGLTGYNSAIQLEFLYYQSPYNLTFIELYVSVLGLSYVGLIFMAAITLFISSKGKNPFICVILSALVLYLPTIDLSSRSYFVDKIISLFPANIMNANGLFELGVFYNIFGIPLLQPILMMVIAIFGSGLLVRSTYNAFKNYQVQ